jgi:hypothetical protein
MGVAYAVEAGLNQVAARDRPGGKGGCGIFERVGVHGAILERHRPG